jgi:homoserine O-acetyltransferase
MAAPLGKPTPLTGDETVAPAGELIGRAYAAELPASGAWITGDDVGDRRFHCVRDGRPFALESGEVLDQVVIGYETWGELNEDHSNAILVCHALTGDSHAYGKSGSAHATSGWWNGIVGPADAIDTERYFVVCANVLGGCQGSTGPASLDPLTERRYGSSFPTVTIRDMVRTQQSLADELGIDVWHSVVGGSMGGMQALEWAAMWPERMRSLVSVASTAAATAEQIAWSAIGRTALVLDPKFERGDYYDAEPGNGPHAGLAVARSVAQVTYRSEEVYDQRFGRDLVEPHAQFGAWDRYQVESYLDYHGQKLAARFDANSYLVLNKAMDLHDVARGRGSTSAALARFAGPSLVVSISSDRLYPPRLQEDLAHDLRSGGRRVDDVMIESPDGHDGFLLATDALGPHLSDFLGSVQR